jgi:hypothetical protein
VEIVITESQLKKIISEATETNATYTTGQDNYFTSSKGNKIKIPKGTRFTAHNWNGKNLATVDRIEGGKNVPSTIFYCESGKFFNRPSNATGYDKTKVLSKVLWDKVCGRASLDKVWADKKKYKDSIWKDKNGVGVPYNKSVDFKRTEDWLKSSGFNTKLQTASITPQNPSHHMNLVAVENIRSLTNLVQYNTGPNYGCMAYGLSSLGNTKSLGTGTSKPGSERGSVCSNIIPNYSKSTAAKLIECGKQLWDNSPTRNTQYSSTDVNKMLSGGKVALKAPNGYEGVFLIDFYYDFGEILKDVSTTEVMDYYRPTGPKTNLAPEGWAEFFLAFYGNYTKAYNSIKTQRVTCFVSPNKQGVDPHTVFTTLGIASSFIPGVGFVIAAGFGLLDATTYYIEGKTTEGGIATFISLIPFISKIPGVQSFTKQTFESLIKKILSGGALNKVEQRAYNLIKTNKEQIQREINAYAKINLPRWKAKLYSAAKKWAIEMGKDSNKPASQLIIDFVESQTRMYVANQTGVPTKGTTGMKYYASKLKVPKK